MSTAVLPLMPMWALTYKMEVSRRDWGADAFLIEVVNMAAHVWRVN